MALHEVAFALEFPEALRPVHKLPCVRQVLLDELLHFLLDLFQVLGSERSLAEEVVEESILGCGPVAKLGLRKKLKHSRCQQMSRGMAVDFKCLGIAVGKNAEVSVFVKRPREIDQVPVSFGRKRGICKTRANGLGNIERSGALWDLFGAAVGKL